jgi:AraC-like DNA-binding protein
MEALFNTSLPAAGAIATACITGHHSTRSLLIKKDDLEKVIAAKTILEKEYYNHYTQDELAYKVGTNECKLKMYFREVTGKGLYEYLTDIRMEKVKELLEITDIPLKAIAHKVGLDRSNLNKNFKKATGITPKEWRKVKSSRYTIILSNLPGKEA